MERNKRFYEKLAERGVTRRDFMKYCTFLTATMGLSSSFVPQGGRRIRRTEAEATGHMAALRGVYGMLGIDTEITVSLH